MAKATEKNTEKAPAKKAAAKPKATVADKSAKVAKAPKKAAPVASGKTFKLTLDKSLIGCNYSQRETVRCLGLKKRQSTSVVADNPANRGQILKVQHLITVEVVR